MYVFMDGYNFKLHILSFSNDQTGHILNKYYSKHASFLIFFLFFLFANHSDDIGMIQTCNLCVSVCVLGGGGDKYVHVI